MDLNTLQSHKLREAIRENRVSFPAQAPAYERQSRRDIQWRLAVLYFVNGWTLFDIARRYGLSRERAGQIVRAWRILSVKRGYIQEIPANMPALSVVRPAVIESAMPLTMPQLTASAAAMNVGGLAG